MIGAKVVHRLVPAGIQPRIMLALFLLGLIQIGITGLTGMFYIKNQLENQLANKNLEQARSLALMPGVREAIAAKDSEALQSIVDQLHHVLGASFVAIGDADGIRLAHRYPERIGKPMVGGDNDQALKSGESYISAAVGSMGPSIRGKAAVFDDHGNIIGVISVGYLVNEVESLADAQVMPMILVIGIVLGLSLIVATQISHKLKQATLGLEPKEIARRYKEQINRLNKQIQQVRSYADLLRVQTHEYSNRLSTISGLLQLGAVDRAVELIHKESSGYQSVIAFLQQAVPEPVIAGVLLGKYHRANELGLELEIDADSQFADIPQQMDTSHIVTILGNLIDNAFDATLEHLQNDNRRVFISLTDIGNDLIIEVEDSGQGIPLSLKDSLFELGATSKDGDGHGYGLFLVKEAVDQLKGYLTFDDAEPTGTRFTVYIPKYP